MKIWIVRLTGKILTQYSKTTVISDQQTAKSEGGSSPFLKSASVISDVSSKSEEDQILEYNKRSIIGEVIEHSRKLPMLQYDRQTNYTRIKGVQYFYLARHKLLFIYALQAEQHSVLAIQNILEKVVMLYETKCDNFCGGYKLPNKLTDYQSDQLVKLSYKINDIVEEEQNVNEWIRSESLRDPEENTLVNTVKEFGVRSKGIHQMAGRGEQIRRSHIRYVYEIEKKVTRYRIKVCLLLFVVGVVCVAGLYFIFRNGSAVLQQ